MTHPKAYITRRIPQPALDIVAAACDYAIWDNEEQPVPRDVLFRAAAWWPTWRSATTMSISRR